MPTIRQLPQSVVNKIAAGEVIERPASVVKEFIENSVDAGASRVEVTVEQGGVDLVRVADDGTGMSADQLSLAVASHATSKIASAEDLFRVGTLGFRGEALASIAAISQLVLRSRTTDADAGYELIVNGGLQEGPAPCGCPVGTTVEIRNLFFNTPVRRKFLRTTQTEMGHVTEAFTRIALAFPRVHFLLRHNDRTILDLAPHESWRDRIAMLFGDELAESLIWIENKEGDVDLSGYVADPSQSRANNRMQYLFLNGRHIRDRSLQHALGEAYRGLLMTGRYPIAFLRIEMSAEQVDVNVHPTKLEVRFQDGGRIYSQLLGSLRNKFLTTDLTARHPGQGVPSSMATETETTIATFDQGQAAEARREISAWAGAEAFRHTDAAAESQVNRQGRMDLIPQPRSHQLPSGPSSLPPDHSGIPRTTEEQASVPLGAPPAMQIHNCYLITECADGIMVIDQHALHERILYEQLRDKVLGGSVETQSLLVPEPVNLTPQEAAAVLDARETLHEMGIRVEPFGGDTVLVAGYPAMLANINPAELLRQVVDLLLDGGPGLQRRDILDELLHMVSCKAAVKAGDRLTPEEIQALIDERRLVQDSHHCPHGRPTTWIFSRQDLDRKFGRI